MKKEAIGIFDSGVGGLTVFSAIREKFPDEDLIYFGDTARVPYGPKSRNTIIEYSIQNARFLNSFQVKLIIVACNTSSAIAIDELRKKFAVPVIGVLEPGADQAVRRTRNKRIGIIGTEGTINSNAYQDEMRKIVPEIETFALPCPLFVPIVEEGWHDHQIADIITREYLNPLLTKEIDTLVLGCTHYPVLKPVIQKIVGEQVVLIDSAEAVTSHLEAFLTTYPENSCSPEGQKARGADFFYVSDNEDKFRHIASRLLNRDITNLTKVRLAESWFV